MTETHLEIRRCTFAKRTWNHVQVLLLIYSSHFVLLEGFATKRRNLEVNILFCSDLLRAPRERGESERVQLELEQAMRDKERRVLDGRRKAIEEKRKLLELQAGAIDPPSHDAKEPGASVTG